MALSNEARQLKQNMGTVVTFTRALEALKEECRQLAEGEACLGEDLIWQLLLEKRVLERRRAAAGLKNWAKFRTAGLNARRMRLFKLRYVQGCSWAQIMTVMGCSKQYLLREHNRALEQVVKAA